MAVTVLVCPCPSWCVTSVGLPFTLARSYWRTTRSLVAATVVPAESSATGATLWLVAAWLLLAASWTLARLRDPSIAPLRLDRVDLAVALLVAPQLISALLLGFTSDGNARAAANVGCEWIGVLVSFVLLRRWLRGRADFAAVVRLALALAIGISLLGIWQHHVGYRQAIAEFDSLENELADAKQVGNISTIRRLQSELSGMKGREAVLLAAAETNAAAQARVLKAAKALLRARSFEDLIRVINDDLPGMLSVGTISLCIETEAALLGKGGGTGVIIMKAGMVASSGQQQ